MAAACALNMHVRQLSQTPGKHAADQNRSNRNFPVLRNDRGPRAARAPPDVSAWSMDAQKTGIGADETWWLAWNHEKILRRHRVTSISARGRPGCPDCLGGPRAPGGWPAHRPRAR